MNEVCPNCGWLSAAAIRDLELYAQIIRDLEKELREAQDVAFDLFNQHCHVDTYGIKELNDHKFKYDHKCLSANETAQDYFIKLGKVKNEECLRS